MRIYPVFEALLKEVPNHFAFLNTPRVGLEEGRSGRDYPYYLSTPGSAVGVASTFSGLGSPCRFWCSGGGNKEVLVGVWCFRYVVQSKMTTKSEYFYLYLTT